MKLEINNLIKEYGEIKALSNVSIELEDVSVLTLIGPSGGGKSTSFSSKAVTMNSRLAITNL